MLLVENFLRSKSFHQNIKKKIFDFNVRNFHFRSKGTASRRAYKVGEMCLENKDTDCAYLQEGTCSRNLIAGLACFALVSWFSRARACVCVCARIETWPRRRITGWGGGGEQGRGRAEIKQLTGVITRALPATKPILSCRVV